MLNNELTTQVFSIENEMEKLDLDIDRKDEVLAIVENLDLIKNPQKVLELGANNRDSLADLSNQMLSLVTNDQLGVMGELMTDITVKLKRTDFSIGSDKSNIPLIGGLLAKIGNSKDRLITKFKTVESQLNDNLLQVAEAQKGLQLNNDSLTKLFEHTISVYTQLGLEVVPLV
ncbi:toxic anion resistance protein (plasmid) [Acinetobacter baumannii]|uniref:toxic anion resistance protein n=1 Tax=Acinetobacter baumannii TaxID=470 RepID=UPI002E330101|nr:toxic anion resistance protein [Acinetobacter baumannii]